MAGPAEDHTHARELAVDAGSGSSVYDHDHDEDAEEMRQVDQVRRDILDRIRPFASIDLPLQEAWGCVLAQDMVADSQRSRRSQR